MSAPKTAAKAAAKAASVPTVPTVGTGRVTKAAILAALAKATDVLAASAAATDEAAARRELDTLHYLSTLAKACDAGAITPKGHADVNAAKVAARPLLKGYVQTSPDTVGQYARAGRVLLLGGLPVDTGSRAIVRAVTQGGRVLGTTKVDAMLAAAKAAKATAADTLAAIAKAAKEEEEAKAKAAKAKAAAEAKAAKAKEAKEAKAAEAKEAAEAARPRTAAELLAEVGALLAAAKAAGILASDDATLRSIGAEVTRMLGAPRGVTPGTVAAAAKVSAA